MGLQAHHRIPGISVIVAAILAYLYHIVYRVMVSIVHACAPTGKYWISLDGGRGIVSTLGSYVTFLSPALHRVRGPRSFLSPMASGLRRGVQGEMDWQTGG